VNLDGGKAGLWPGFSVTMHVETRYGNDVNDIDGMFSSPISTWRFIWLAYANSLCALTSESRILGSAFVSGETGGACLD
jgi:hypothetical protein